MKKSTNNKVLNWSLWKNKPKVLSKGNKKLLIVKKIKNKMLLLEILMGIIIIKFKEIRELNKSPMFKRKKMMIKIQKFKAKL